MHRLSCRIFFTSLVHFVHLIPKIRFLIAATLFGTGLGEEGGGGGGVTPGSRTCWM